MCQQRILTLITVTMITIMVITARAYAIATSYFHEKTPILKLSGAALI